VIDDPRDDGERKGPQGDSGAGPDYGDRGSFGQNNDRRDSVYPANELKIPTIELPKGGGALKSASMTRSASAVSQKSTTGRSL
jgi:hypothetical protein